MTDTLPQNALREPPVRGDALSLAPDPCFVCTPEIDRVASRAAAYLEAGYPVHLAGPAGTGKTTLAFHIAAQRGRPVSLLHGNESFNGNDLLGNDRGYRRTAVVDNYIHSVLKTEENLDVNWVDNRLTTACRLGHTLIYDEFNRTRAEANNILLSILEEGILTGPAASGSHQEVHPAFRLILTSNPVEYAGVHRAQDALLDRLITIRCDHYDADTETRIVAGASDVAKADAGRIVRLVRSLRELRAEPGPPTVRGALALARVTTQLKARVDASDELFLQAAWDVLGDAASDLGEDEAPLTFDEFCALVGEVIPARVRKTRAKRAAKAA
jgi:nitric oxide reductase NorQ protein